MSNSIFSKSFNWVWLAVIFVGVLCYFVLGSGWYEPSRLIIQGQCPAGTPLLQVSWDSGAGFNGYEKRVFRPHIQPLDNNNTNKLLLGGTDRRHPASLSDNVVCTAIIIDGKHLDLQSLDKNVPYHDGGLSFSHGQTISLSVSAGSHISFKFRTNNHSGIAYISVNGVETEYDLYMANEAAKFKQFNYWLLLADGSFNVDMDMPRYAINELKIKVVNDAGLPLSMDLIEIRGKGHVVDLLSDSQTINGEISFFDALESMRSYYDLWQFVQQVVFALLTTWLLVALVTLYRKIGSIQACLIEEKRFVFWIMFGSSFFVFSLWLVAFWPGVMSVDSLKVWRAAMLPDVYLNDHPVLNVFLYKYMYQLWNNPAVIPFVQLVFMALLISWFYFWLYKQRVSIIVLLLCFLFTIFSVPIGVYNLMLWKDIPFALLIVFWACMLMRLYWQRRQGSLRWSNQQVFALFFLGVALGLVRHNGLVYLVVLPFLFVVFRFVSLKTVLIMLFVFVLMAGGSYTALKRVKGMSETDFLGQQIQRYAGGASIKDVVENSRRILQDYMTVLDINQTNQKWDKFHYYFNDRYAYWFLLHSGWWDLYPYKKVTVPFPWLKQKAMKVYEKSYQKPWVWLSWNPVWLLALLPVVTILFWWFPHSAVFGIVLLAGAIPLIYLRIFNWRYYYFLYLGLLFMLPLVAFDLSNKKTNPISQ